MNKKINNNLNKIINTIMTGDVLDNIKKIPDNSIDLIFVDPPYFMQTEGTLIRNDGSKFNGVEDDWDKFKDYKDYDNFCFNWLKECKRVLNDNGSIWVIGSFQNIYRIGYIMQNMNFWILNDIIWSKPNAVPNFAGTRFKNSHETLLWCVKTKNAKFTFNYKTMKFLNDNKQEKSVWDIGICIGNERLKNSEGQKLHSTQKPEKLLYKILLSSTKPGDIVLDPFFGTGTTGVVAKMLGRRWIGIEKDENYCVAALERIKKVKEETDEITNLSLEVKPPRVPMEKLVKANLLKVNEHLYNKNQEKICTILKSGKTFDGEEKLSIHKMSAKYLNRINNNGWHYFYIIRDKKFVSINDLRYKYIKGDYNNDSDN